MKRLYFFFLISLALSANAQQSFYSEGDVFYYLNTNSFRNDEVGVTVSFSDMGAYLNINGNMTAFNPEVSIRSSKSVILKYYLINDYNSNLRFLLDGNTGSLVDANTKRVYYRVDMYSQNSSSSSNVESLKNYSWAKKQAEKQAEDILSKNSDPWKVMNRFKGAWVHQTNRGNHYIVLERGFRNGLEGIIFKIYIEYSPGNWTKHEFSISQLFSSFPNTCKIEVEPIYLRKDPNGDNIFYHEFYLNVVQQKIRFELVDDGIFEGATVKRIGLNWGSYKEDFGKVTDEEDLLKIEEIFNKN